jgi:hypothetical protein
MSAGGQRGDPVPTWCTACGHLQVPAGNIIPVSQTTATAACTALATRDGEGCNVGGAPGGIIAPWAGAWSGGPSTAVGGTDVGAGRSANGFWPLFILVVDKFGGVKPLLRASGGASSNCRRAVPLLLGSGSEGDKGAGPTVLPTKLELTTSSRPTKSAACTQVAAPPPTRSCKSAAHVISFAPKPRARQAAPATHAAATLPSPAYCCSNEPLLAPRELLGLI